ncbi:30S ribosomal protein S7 [Candidatus Dojkabacteria bacterium]|nr:30S ribosomal protein S7 [Candidatus Dojkabacteria bacterium]
MRGKSASKRKIQPDPIYSSIKVSQFINYTMLDGKKSTAQKAVYSALEGASSILKEKPLDILEVAIKNIAPSVEVRSRRVGGATYQVPVPVTQERQVALAFKCLISISRSKSGKDFKEFLTAAIVDAYKGEGEAVKKKQDTEKMAEANKAFAHFRW